MALFRKFFYRKPPDGLLEISERVYVFDCCFTTDICEDEEYKVYIGNTVAQLRDHFPDASFMVFNFREGETQSRIASILSEYDMTVMDYPRHYEGCPLLTMEMIHHFLRSSESWLSLGQQNVLLMHCERGGWPVLAFMLAALLIYRKQYTGEQKTLDMIYKQAPRELLQLMAPLNPLPSQLRYLQYVSRRNVGSEWPPLDRALTLDCVILRVIPNLDYEGGCRPIFRIYGQDPLMVADSTPKVLFSTPKNSNLVRHYKQADCDLVKIDIHCHIQGDVVMECISLDSNLEREQMVFRVMFNTAFIRSNILMLNRDEVDRLWNFKEFPKDFRAEVLFSEMDTGSNHASVDLPCLDEKDGLPVEAFAKVQEMFSTVDWLDSKTDVALNVLQQITAIQENLETNSPRIAEIGSVLLESTLEKIQENPKKGSEKKARGFESIILDGQSLSSPRLSPVANEVKKTDETEEGKFTIQSMSIAKQSPNSSLAGPQEQTLSLQTSNKLSSGGDSVRKKSEPENLHISVQRPAQSKIISPRVPQALASPPVPSQGSPMAISKYQTSPSPLGITALLHDHAASKGEEVARPVTVTLLSSTVSSPAKDTPKSVEVSHEFNKDLPQAPTMPLLHSSIQAVCSIESSATLHSSSPQTSKTTHSSFHQASEPSLNRTEVPIVSPLLPNSSSTTLFPPFPPSPPPPPPPPLSLENAPGPTVRSLNSTPPPPTLKGFSSSVPSAGSSLQPENKSATLSGPLPPPPPPLLSKSVQVPVSAPTPPPPPLPSFSCVSRGASPSPNAPPPPPPAPFGKATSKGNGVSPQTNSAVSNGNVPPVPGPPSTAHFSAIGRGFVRTNPKHQVQSRKANLKPYHWLKLTRAMQGSLWAEAQKSDEATKAPEFDLSELESLFSAAAPNSEPGSTRGKTNRRISGAKSDTVQLVELRRAYNCEIMLSKVKIPLPDLMSSVLALDDSALDVDQVDNLIKFCPTKEEMEMLKGYSGDKEKLGKCEQFFLELMKVPRVESKLRVFSFKIQFNPQVSDLRRNLHVVNSVAEEIRTSMKLKQVMQTILSLGNALNHGTARGSAIGFRLDSLLKLTDTRGRNNKMTLMHYLCKVLAEKLPDLLDFPRDLMSLEAATKIQLKYLAEEMQAISKGLEKVVQELSASENDGLVSQKFCKTLKAFLSSAESEVRSLASLYSNVGRNADALAHYFGEDPARCPFEQVVSTLLNFARMFVRAHEENCKQLELEKKKEQKEAENEKLKRSASRKEIEKLIQSPRRSGNVK